MKCPNCDDTTLKPNKLEEHLPSLICDSCGGTCLSLIAYREWRDTHPTIGDNLDSTDDDIIVDETRRASICPKCSRIMIKYRYMTDKNHGLDLCSHCDEIWLDQGEWTLLKQHDLHGNLPEIFTEPWQRNLKSKISKSRFEEIYEQRFGQTDYQRIKEIREWIKINPKKVDLLCYLNNEDPYQK